MELNQFRDVDVVLDKANDNIIQKQFVSAGDKDGRSLTAQLTDNGVIGEIIGAAMNLYWHNQASGLTDLSAFYVVDRATSVFKIDYPQNMLTPGKVIAYIQVMHGGKVTHTKPFEITVQKLAGTTRGVLATAEYGALVTTLAKANKFETDIANLASTKVDKTGTAQVEWQNAAQSLRDRITGGTPTAGLGPNDVLETNIADSAVTQRKIARNAINYKNVDGHWGFIHGFDTFPFIKINYQTNTIVCIPTYVFVNSTRFIIPATTIPISASGITEDVYLIFNPTSGEVRALISAEKQLYAGDSILLCIVRLGRFLITQSDRKAFELIDVFGKMIETPMQYYGLKNIEKAVVSDPSAVEVNFQNQTVKITKHSIYALLPERSKTLTVDTFNITQDPELPKVVKSVYVDMATGNLTILPITAERPLKLNFLFHIEPTSLKCYPDVEGIKVVDYDGNAIVDEQAHHFKEMVLPDKLFLMEEYDLPLYKSSILHKTNIRELPLVQTSIIIPETPLYENFSEKYTLNTNKITTDFRIGTVQADTYKKSYKTLGLVKGNKANLENKSPNMLLIGDSLTHDNLARVLVEKLTEKGASPQIVGTFQDSLTSGYSTEARGYWNYRVFTGQSSIVAGIPITLPSASATTTTKFENPFLRLATQADYAQHPDWCFRRTAGGKLKELSYAEDADKTGSFYIFDFAWYLSQRQIPIPEVVTIALSTNDIQLDTPSVDWFLMAQKGLKILIEQIKLAVPNVKIGVIPAPEWGENDRADGFESEVKKWIEYCKVAVKSYTNVDVVPVWMHMNENWDWDMSKNVVTLPSGEVQGETSDSVHFGEAGRREYAEAVTHWLSTKQLSNE